MLLSLKLFKLNDVEWIVDSCNCYDEGIYVKMEHWLYPLHRYLVWENILLGLTAHYFVVSMLPCD